MKDLDIIRHWRANRSTYNLEQVESARQAILEIFMEVCDQLSEVTITASDEGSVADNYFNKAVEAMRKTVVPDMSGAEAERKVKIDEDYITLSEIARQFKSAEKSLTIQKDKLKITLDVMKQDIATMKEERRYGLQSVSNKVEQDFEY